MFVALLLLNLFGCTLAQDSRCNGVPSTGWSCCNSQTPCEVGGGDCDRDSDCLGSLMCGNNNCRDDFSSDGSNWSSGADCCYDNANECTGSPSTDWNCCSEAFPCALGGGDCDNDEQCQGSLVCGADNCARDFSSNGHNPNWASGSDCCRETAEYVKSSNEGACCVDSTEQHEGCVVHSSYADATEETCKRACDNDAFCKGYSIKDVNGGMFCRLATTPSQCPHNWETISGGNAPLDPTATCESSFSGCYVKQNANIPVTVPTTPLVTTTTEATTMPVTTTNSGPAPTVTMCDGTTEVLTPGTIIKTTNYPNDYLNRQTCQVTITFSDSPTVLIEFNPQFGIEPHSDCNYDYLSVYDGPDTGPSPLIGKLCGNTAPAPIQSTGNSMTLSFQSDGSVTGVGFEITANPAGPVTTTTPRPSLPPPSSANCGVKPPSRIIGGAPAGPYSLPWQVALVEPNNPTPFCGGTLISDRHVLTAAHCTDRNEGVWDVMVGEHDSSDPTDGTRHAKCRFQNHPDFIESPWWAQDFNNDFAIVTLSQPVTIGTRANYACLPTVDEMGGNFLDDKTVTVSGWGNRCGSGTGVCPPTDLHVVDLPAMSNSACQQLVDSGTLAFPITDSMVCAGRTGDNAVGACHGDSGGPLTYTDGGITTVVGAVSWGNPRCLGTTVFARVTNVLPWIQEQMRQAGECDSVAPATTPQPPVTTPQPPATTTASSGEVNICDSQAAQVITVPGTTIISPNHPGDYQNNLDCQVSIQLSERVRIRFEAFNVESHTTCRYDYLEVRDGDSSSSSMIGSKLCGDLIPDAIESTGSSMTLVFHTDSSAIRTGFKIVVELATGELTTYTPPSVECGRKPLNTKIVGGGEVTPFSLPWQVALASSSGRFFCGGTLIGPRHVLTAAHCMGGSFNVIVGEHDKTDSSDGTRHSVCRAVSHPNYCDTPNNIYCINNDFAIVTLTNPVQVGPRAVPACLPTASAHGGSFLDDKNVTTSGWGRLQSGGSSPNVLHKVTVPGVSNAVCQQLYEGRYGPNAILSDMICAGNTVEGGVDACQGDSGGPLTYDDQGSAVVVGVVSWGHGCALTDYPGVYSRVTEVLPWINEQMTECP